MDINYYLKVGIIWYTMFLMSLVIHEVSHAYLSNRFGDKTAFKAGLNSINPIPHIKRNIVGLLIFPIIFFIKFGFMLGWADTPFNSDWARKNPKHLALTMLSGPITNLLLFLFFFSLILILIRTGIFFEPNLFSLTLFAYSKNYMILAYILCIGFSINLILLIWNMIPFPTLDGFSIVFLFLNRDRAGSLIDKFFNKSFSIISGIGSGIIFLLFIGSIHETIVRFLYFLALLKI